jgi:hypothetical protein
MYDQMKPKRNLTDIAKGDWVNGAEVLVIKVMGTSGYVGCPNCFTKKEGVEEGISYQCTTGKCAGAQRVATKLIKWVLLGSDESTKVILDFPPFGYKLEDGETLKAKVVSIKGRVQEPRQNKDKTGKVVGTTPVIMVKDLKVVSDIRDGTAAAASGAALPSPPAPADRQPTPAPSPVTPPPAVARTAPSASAPAPTTSILATEIAPEKLNAFSLWMTFRTENGAKPVPEAQLKSYVENNLKIHFEAFVPYLEQVHTDSQGELYRLKAKANTG